MGTTNIIGFANSTGADVQSDDTYKANAPLGFVPGPAYPNQANKAMRQVNAVAVAIAKLVTDQGLGNQDTFNDSEDGTALASKISAALYNLPSLRGVTNMVKLLTYLLSDPVKNPASAAKFDAASVGNLTDLQARALAANELYAALLTRNGIIENPPIMDWLYLQGQPTDWTRFTGVPGYIGQREYRRLANGMVEVRIGFTEGFETKPMPQGTIPLGMVPSDLAPIGIVTAPLYGAMLTTDASTQGLAPFRSQVTVGIMPYGASDAGTVYAFVNPTADPGGNITWKVKGGLPEFPTGMSPPRKTTASLCYMPRLPYPYAYYRPPAP